MDMTIYEAFGQMKMQMEGIVGWRNHEVTGNFVVKEKYVSLNIMKESKYTKLVFGKELFQNMSYWNLASTLESHMSVGWMY